MNPDRARKLIAKVMKTAEGDEAAAWAQAQPLMKASKQLREAAIGLVLLAKEHNFEYEQALEAVAAVADDHPQDPEILGLLGEAFEGLCDVRYPNASPPEEPVLLDIARLILARERAGGLSPDEEVDLLRGLGTAARLLGRKWDEVTERCEKRLIELQPQNWHFRYNLGLFFKSRGRFEEGCAANQEAFERGGADDNSVQWNLGICATGAGQSERALEVWKSFGHKIEIGRFGLPDGPYADVKVCLAEFPLAERAAEDEQDPGLEETVWVERLSPCHGIIRSALYQDLGVDFGDVVLFDGAPITHHQVGGEQVAVFPHLATLVRSSYLIVPFGGTQARARQIGELTRELPDDSVLYPHTEMFQIVCRECWEGGRPHQHHDDQPEHRVVTGKLCAPPGTDPAEFLSIIDRVAAQTEGVQLFIPDLAEMAGDSGRAEVEARRLRMISESQ